MITPEQLTHQIETRRAESEALLALWTDLLPSRVIDPYQFKVWLRLHPFSRVVLAIERTAKKSAKLGGQMDVSYAVKFCSSVCNDLKGKEQHAA
jgi:hypothetical protein